MTKVSEIRDMSEEQIRLVWKDAAETLFRLRMQAQTEKLAAPSDVRKQRQTIARCQTILTQRGVAVVPTSSVAAAPASRPRVHGIHAKKKRRAVKNLEKIAVRAEVSAKKKLRKQVSGGK